MHEPFTNLRKIIFLQFARDTARTEVWRGLRVQDRCARIAGKSIAVARH